MFPSYIIAPIDGIIGSIREMVNDGKSTMSRCQQCNSEGPHEFAKINPRFGNTLRLKTIGSKIYKCKNCGAQINVNGEVV